MYKRQVWIRTLQGDGKGYGWVDDETPELSIALMPHHRGAGLGSRLMIALFEAARWRHHAISLSVSRENPALRLYERLGFEAVHQEGGSVAMRKHLGSPPRG